LRLDIGLTISAIRDCTHRVHATRNNVILDLLVKLVITR